MLVLTRGVGDDVVIDNQAQIKAAHQKVADLIEALGSLGVDSQAVITELGELVRAIEQARVQARVVVVEVRRYQVRLGFEVPKAVMVHRGEVYQLVAG